MKSLISELKTLPQDRATWRLTEGKAVAPVLPRDLRKMTERQRQETQQYLQTLPLQELRRRHDAVHAQQSEAHQHQRYYGTNTSHSQAVANLEVMDDLLRRAIEFVEDTALAKDTALSDKYDIKEPAWQYKNWALPTPDDAPAPHKQKPAIAAHAIESKYGIDIGVGTYAKWRLGDEDGE